ncbi:MAG: YlxM family DNA-binding protein [Lachnospiraceae bacterium]|nr:YlxM family DNA-binding protein [Lachnospiraceae bacterium]
MEKLYEESLLYDFYGELLTEHQKQVFEDAVLNDYSLAEVAEDLGISRQGVHDLVKRTRQALAGYEEKLHLVQKFIRIRDNVNRIQKMTEDEGIRKLTEEILEEL